MLHSAESLLRAMLHSAESLLRAMLHSAESFLRAMLQPLLPVSPRNQNEIEKYFRGLIRGLGAVD
jgi:hypothetical protein